MTSVGDATTVDVGSTLGIMAEVDTGLDNEYYTIVLSVDAETYGTISPKGELGSTNVVNGKYVTTLTGVDAGAVVITSEVKQVTWVNGVRTLVSLDTPVTDTITITVTAA